jgi:hypothetical protein
LYTWDLQPKLLDEKQTTIYKRAVDRNYHLKMKASRFIFSEINQKFPIMPFTARCVVLCLFHRIFKDNCLLGIVHSSTFYSKYGVSLQQGAGGEEGSAGFGGMC